MLPTERLNKTYTRDTMYSTLRDFIAALEHAGELKRIAAPVSPILEIAEITDRISKQSAPTLGLTGRTVDPAHAALGGSALLFEQIEGVESDIPVAINLFGSYHRLEMALGCHPEGHTPGGFDAIGERIASALKPTPPCNFADALAKAREFLPLLRIGPKRVRTGICQEVVKTGTAVNLFEIPLIRGWPLDGDPAAVGWPIPTDQPDTSTGQGRFITLAGMYTIHADDRGKRKPPSFNIGMYRAQLINRRQLAMHWHLHHDGAAHWRSWQRLGEPMPIAIAFGGESALPYAATAPLPPGISEILMAGFLQRRPIRLVRGKTVPLEVPANAEIILEGYASTECGPPDFNPWQTAKLGPGAVLEGPFGDHTGFYSLPDRYPLLTITAITHRRNPIYPTTIVGLPPQEDYYLGKATERVFFPLLKTVIHDLQDYDLPMFGCFHNCAILKIRKEYPLQARRIMHAVWGAGQMSWTKIIIVVDEEIDVHDLNAVMQALFANCHFARDLELVTGPLDILDHAAPYHGAGKKIGLDATRKIAGEEINGISLAIPNSTPPTAVPIEILKKLSGVREVAQPGFGQGRCIFVALEKTAGTSARPTITKILRALADLDSAGVFVVDAGVDLSLPNEVFFRWGSNADPGRDLLRLDEQNTAGVIAFDCTVKTPDEATPTGGPIRHFPPILEMEAKICRKVTERWERDFGFSKPRELVNQ